ncbi:polymorphic toxin-type HINT domain-containing protein [Allorhodopirellula solitaria]|uniref:Intein C-terminal splicing domain-containing protein n=1 Tax=Allorhodopirellula solitaria TaxID=2527987 RepID=A0A5C5WXY1_9BACT|nr:polymorphic toxin-type HINT domain-containing protein [Allorhodopirellula solitaria]TWT55527.1 hypothetical protein CA85_48800 [Allorhodopirellula solitaria]
MKAAKEKILFMLVIASALLVCAPAIASSTHHSTLENRAEIFLQSAQNRVERQAFESANRVENYDSLGGVALESSVAPNSTAGRVVSGGCFVAGTPVRLSAELAMATLGGNSEATTTTANPTTPATTTAIEHVAIGARVPDQNPRPEDYDFSLRDVDQDTWRQLDVRLRRKDGAVVEMQLLRPVEWVENLNLSVGSEFTLILSEFEVDGNAVVTAIGPCCEIAEGEGSVVTGRFVTRQVSNLVEVTLENGTTFTGTTTHPVWIPAKHDWVELGDLNEGEKLATLAGSVTVAKVRRPKRVSDVFNIEVHGHHVYRITDDGVLVHNNSSVGKALVEAATRRRAQSQLGRRLTDSADPAFDYVDDLDRTYDQMGNPAMIPHWASQRSQFFNQIDRHLQKADFTVIDLTSFPKQIQDDVANYVLNLPEHLFDKVIPIGF